MKIYGPAVLYNDEGDVSDEIWAEIRSIIISKREKKIPEDVLALLKEQGRDMVSQHGFTCDRIPSHYGKTVRDVHANK